MTPLRHTYSLRKRRHTTPVSPVTEEAAASTEIDVLSDGGLSSPSDDIPTDSDITSKGPGRVCLRSRPAGADLPRPGASAAAEARQRRILRTSEARQFRKRPRHVSFHIPDDGDSPSASQTKPAPSNNHASLLHTLAEASVSCPDETTASMVEEESENRKMDELGAGPVGKGQEAVVEEKSDHEIFKLDSQVLDCNICFKPLKPPIFQFINAIRVPCSNTKYGCDEFITQDQKEKHESGCTHAPCFCPEDGCSFIGSRVSLLDHFVTKHGWLLTNLHYKKSLGISMARDRRFTLLVGEDMSIFILTNTLTDIGNALTLVCIRPHESEPSYSSKISAVPRGSGAAGRLVFLMDPLVASSSLQGGVQLGKFFLLVPPELVDESTDELTINIRIDELTSKSQQEAVA
ncbi:E3 ubiquitin-protein ligase SINA-like 7 isoform X2 [Lolium perenne]|uniref:E3 ubiquitin-protein ligase SINA-like 7 isoform X2 n=1 Tax=Lolium perenne TaxID=4522 RepID=UPI0021F5585A|nr:E3 ubiquitin-protein ligase SINA-like 10 isoform X2 [Lolium perenne]